MKKIIFLFCSFFFFISAFAQITFQKTYMGSFDDRGTSVQQTSDGGYIITGLVNNLATADDVCLIKTDANGDTLWTKTFGGTAHDRGYSVQQTNDGGYVITGTTYNVISGKIEAFLIKTNVIGDSLWTKSFTGTSHSNAFSGQQTFDNGYIICGVTSTNGSANGSSVYLIKTDSTGNLLWSKTFDGTGNDLGNCVRQTVDGGYIITGYANTFGAGNDDVYLIKTDSTGNMTWSKTFGGLDDDQGYSVQQTTDGGYIISGFTHSFGAGGYDVYLIKTDINGDSLWTKTYGVGGIQDEVSNSVQQTTDGGYITIGTIQDLSVGNYNIYLIKTDANGNLLWSNTLGGAGYDAGYFVQQTPDGGYIITGCFNFKVYLIKTDSLGNSGCNQGNPATIVTTPVTIVTTPATIVASHVTIVNIPATIEGSGGIVTTLCTSVGLQEITTENGFSISPNPTTNNFKINYTLPQNKEGTLEIIDVTGKTVYKQKLPMWSTVQNIALPGIANGIYNCVITCGEKRENKRVVVMK